MQQELSGSRISFSFHFPSLTYQDKFNQWRFCPVYTIEKIEEERDVLDKLRSTLSPGPVVVPPFSKEVWDNPGGCVLQSSKK